MFLWTQKAYSAQQSILCKEKKEGETLQLCIPRKVLPPPSAAPWQKFTQIIIAQAGYLIPLRQSQISGRCPGSEQATKSEECMGYEMN